MKKLVLISGLLIFGTSLCGPGRACSTLELLKTDCSGWLNGAWFETYNPANSTGTGVFEPFLRIQGKGVETGYNTDGAVEGDTKAGLWTHSIQVSDIPVVEKDGFYYREFLLDIDEQNNRNRYISLDVVKIFVENSPALSGYPQAFNNLIYNLDSSGDSRVVMNGILFGPGSGSGDVRMLIPDILFSQTNDYVYLYSEFGYDSRSDNWRTSADAGFEEWGVLAGVEMTSPSAPPAVPAPGALVLAFLGTGTVGLLRTRKTKCLKK